jgi:hypothetical protein
MEAVSPDLENKAFAVVFLIGNLAYSPPACPDFFRVNGNALKKKSG